MTTCSSHVLDAALGRPAAGLAATLEAPDGTTLSATTDADGRIAWGADLGPGRHVLTFATGAWFAAQDRAALHPEVPVVVAVTDDQPHYHVALLLSPFAYTTYRGS